MKSISAAKVSSEDSWKVENDLRTLIECEKIEKDPRRMKAVRALAKQKSAEIQGIVDDESSEKE